ncbi:methyltransferase domain-containing protein [Streptomyces sp. HC44]|uniref:Methyltransferase domain-containing protein n=1 Tax=Streptomyces scabichelini TaxID=2711217 RepID=A0A6G4V1C3_9ACTN|nr:class I SAM-dependent methyltransferase [Streptomyces scabichelini]NGO07852.1 methyltransferase domain-containing protein [Streptomyces scabichelini]
MIVRPKVEAYAEEHSAPEPAWLTDLAEETRKLCDLPQMMVGPLEGRFLAMLVHMFRPQRVLEVGTFTGYSALCMAAELPPDGKLVTCEIDPAHAEIAQRHIAKSPWADRIELRTGPALEQIKSLEDSFDLVFIDADKTGYGRYYEAVLPILSERGVIAVDNVLQFGGVANPQDQKPDTVAMREFNEKVRDDPRVEQVMLTIREGVTLIRRA